MKIIAVQRCALAVITLCATASSAIAQVATLACKPEKNFYQDLLCAGDQRYCVRYLQLDYSRKKVVELQSGLERSPTNPIAIKWSDTNIAWDYPVRAQAWPNGKIAYRVESGEVLHRFTGKLVQTSRTTDQFGKPLGQEAANQIVQALGADIKVNLSFGSQSFQCKETERRL